jgi:hypothetical protein
MMPEDRLWLKRSMNMIYLTSYSASPVTGIPVEVMPSAMSLINVVLSPL